MQRFLYLGPKPKFVIGFLFLSLKNGNNRG